MEIVYILIIGVFNYYIFGDSDSTPLRRLHLGISAPQSRQDYQNPMRRFNLDT